MSNTKNMNDLINDHRASSEVIATEKANRAAITSAIIDAGIEADEQIKFDLTKEVTEARKVVQGLTVTLSTAERRKADLDKRIDAGDDAVTPLEIVEADMTVRKTKGKLPPADAALRKAQRALEPFLADNHLAFLAAATLEDLVDVPVLVRTRPSDIRDITDVVILSQTSPTSGYGTLAASGEVGVKVIGNPPIDWEAVQDRLESAGSDVDATPQKR